MTDSPLYKHTGQVRRIFIEDQVSGQSHEVDLMLCDTNICTECQPAGVEFQPNYDYAQQRGKLPLVHHKDVMMIGDAELYFAPSQQSPVNNILRVVQQDVRDVTFGGGKTRTVMLCDKLRCGLCYVAAFDSPFQH
jgi:hypothetical protein